MKHSIAVCLLHLSVNVVAGIAEFGNLFGQQLYSVDRIAEDNALVDLKL